MWTVTTLTRTDAKGTELATRDGFGSLRWKHSDLQAVIEPNLGCCFCEFYPLCTPGRHATSSLMRVNRRVFSCLDGWITTDHTDPMSIVLHVVIVFFEYMVPVESTTQPPSRFCEGKGNHRQRKRQGRNRASIRRRGKEEEEEPHTVN